MKIYTFAIGLLMVLLGTPKVFSQKLIRVPGKQKVEIGIFLGASNYSGDLEENPINFNHTLLGYGGFLRYNFNSKFSLRFGMDQGTIADDDASATASWRKSRNLSFKTSILDGYLAPEFYFANWTMGYNKYASAYIFAGAGVFHFNPQAEYNGVWYDLRPLGTEGQGSLEYADRKPYDPNEIYIPFGGGVRFNLIPTWYLSIEFRANKTFTDYLDDVSTTYASPDVIKAQSGDIAEALANRSGEVNPKYHKDPTGLRRGDPSHKDWFYFTGITISHSFKGKSHCYSF